MDPYSEDERTVELEAILATFPELVISPSDPYTASLDISVTPIQPLKIRFSELLADADPPQLPIPPTSTEDGNRNPVNINTGARDKNGRNGGEDGPVHELEHLPPLHLEITLPVGYPDEQPPQVKLSVSPPWIPEQKLATFTKDCTRLWEEIGHDSTVFMFIDHLQEQAESAFGPNAGNEPISLSPSLQLALLDFNLKTKREKFEKETFDCGVCLDPKKGKDCHRLLMCGHVFCVACLQDFYNNCITEGDVDNVKCMDPSCGKAPATTDERPRKQRRQDRTLNPSELLQIPIEQELVQRYVRLKRKMRLESDKTTIYCPRQWCQGAAKSAKHPKPTGLTDDFVSDDESDAEPVPQPTDGKKQKKQEPEDIPMAMRLAVCEDCDYAFCAVCKKGWHGERATCSPRRVKELEEEEKATLEYIRHYSSPCPTCDAPCQKSHGCNHMICFKCKTHFCYLCAAWLSPDNPYQHFNTQANRCYMRLWELGAGDGIGVQQIDLDDLDDGPEPFDEDNPEEIDDEREQAEPIDMADLADEVEAIVANPIGNVVDDEDDTDDEDVAPNVVQRRQWRAAHADPPAPVQPPRERAIEFVNFAAPQAQGRRIILPNQIEEPAAAAAAGPQEQRPRQQQHGAQGQQQQRRRRQRQPERRRLQVNGIVPNPAAPAARRGVVPPAAPNPPPDQNALRRFLELARRDAEDEWDSDEMPEDIAFGDADDDDVDNDGFDAVNDHHDAAVPDELMRRIDAREGMNRWNMR